MREKISRYLCALIFFALIFGATVSTDAAEAPNFFLTIDSLNPETITKISDCARENITAALAGRSPVLPTDLSSIITTAANGVEIAIVRDGRVIASGSSVEQSSLLANLRLAAGRAVYGFKVADFAQCSLFLAILSAGKIAVTPPPTYAWKRGEEAFQLLNGERPFFVSALIPLLEQWSWRQTLEQVLTKNLPASTPQSQLEFLLSPACKLQVFSALTLVIPAHNDTPQMLNRSAPPLTPDRLNRAIAELLEWWENNTHDDSSTAKTPDLSTDAFAAAAAAYLWRETRNEEIKRVATTRLTQLITQNFLESPGTEVGYLRSEIPNISGDLFATILAVWAANLLDQPTVIAEPYSQMQKYIVMKFTDDIFTADDQNIAQLINNFAVIALLADNPKANSALAVKILPRCGNAQTPAGTITSWRVFALLAAYQSTRQKRWLDEAIALTLKTVDHKPTDNTMRCAADFFTAGQLLPVLKILGNAVRFPQIDEVKKSAELSLRELLNRQISEDSWLALVMTASQQRGGFIPQTGELATNLNDVIAVSFALTQARKNIDLE